MSQFKPTWLRSLAKAVWENGSQLYADFQVTAQILENTLGGVPAIASDDPSVGSMILTDAFPSEAKIFKPFVILSYDATLHFDYSGTNRLNFYQFDVENQSYYEELLKVPVEIRVYPVTP
jgi:hypothetical protein